MSNSSSYNHYAATCNQSSNSSKGQEEKMQGKEKAKAEQEVDRFVELSGKKMATLWSSEDPERTVELEFLDRTIPVFYLDDLLRASAKVLGKGKLGSTYKTTL
ncbi:hypothetical protein Patl1_07778 [Pistacia atlantica]|uniref:Uncharacterized protein n=1 Tax=Pistacia atlantica TaxID=434234 RepID=A0ACC1AF60_9ROSI|nr:hypothetical protein Patl1_07778 [Pistacia atlantica]